MTLARGCLLLAGLLAAGCGGVRTVEASLPYRARVATGDDLRDVTVTVDARGASLSEVRESARYPATVHCLTRIGASDVAWQIDPATGDWATAYTEDGALIVRGRCTAR